MYKFSFNGIHAAVTAPDGAIVTAQVKTAQAEILRALVDKANRAEALGDENSRLRAALERTRQELAISELALIANIKLLGGE